MQESSSLRGTLALVVTGADGQVKETRFSKPLFGDFNIEFLPNKRYISLINQGRIEPHTWKIPFLFGKWSVSKGNS